MTEYVTWPQLAFIGQVFLWLVILSAAVVGSFALMLESTATRWYVDGYMDGKANYPKQRWCDD